MDQDPPLYLRWVWSAILGTICITLLKMGGLKVLQASSLVTALPLVFIIFIMKISLVKMLKEDKADLKFRTPDADPARGAQPVEQELLN